MSTSPSPARRRRLARTLPLLALLIAGAIVASAAARAFTLHAHDARVSGKQRLVVVNSRGFVTYWLSGDSKTHPECTATNQCFQFWPPVTVRSRAALSKAPGVHGKLGTWRRDGFTQVTLNGHPLYTFAPDRKKTVAGGDGITSFGGTWHATLAKPPTSKSTNTPSSSNSGSGW